MFIYVSGFIGLALIFVLGIAMMVSMPPHSADSYPDYTTAQRVLCPAGTFVGIKRNTHGTRETHNSRTSYAQHSAGNAHSEQHFYPYISYGKLSSTYGDAVLASHPDHNVDYGANQGADHGAASASTTTAVDTTIPGSSSSYAFPGHDLQLSITTPATVQSGDDLPVVVFIHGGAYEGGSREEPWFSGTGFAARNIITVTISYRLSLAGFLPFYADTPGHYRGVNDCLLALDWVQKHIEDFGGDPTNVTLMGQSAGAGIGLWLCRKDHYKGTFRRAWLMSPAFPASSFARRKTLLRASLGVPLTREGLAKLAPEKLTRRYRRFRKMYLDLTVGPYPWQPSELAEVPIVLSCLEQEFYNFAPAIKLDQSRYGATTPVRAFMRRMYRVARHYRWDSYKQLLTDFFFRCIIEKTAAAAPHSTWVIQYSGSDAAPGVHCADIPWIFNSQAEIAGTSWELLRNPAQELVSSSHERAVRFIRGHKPDWNPYGDSAQVLSVSLADAHATLVADPFAHLRGVFRRDE
ncbi:carboxylesterase family protein [Corynebacterium sp. sy039]|uniref:carboxylesterase family protein n=1 Tax=Corynebacterium sp. sy039 TaxID=2599641 RepID=UPI0011B37B0D|nr:carboxylesterase family protein [Corynebacterium sp. sy039]QDZ43026.1 carboxylesterase/lipase family protein [Corynebacterium sp. sy039]